jgi:Dolichyl-phosphate-mannose-protein mannosyltransferase
MTGLLIFVTLNVAFWAGVGALVADRSGSDALEDTLAVAVAGFACMVVVLEALGTIGLINRTTITLACSAMAAAGFFRYRSASSVPAGTGSSRVSGAAMEISWTAALACVVIGLAVWASLAHVLAGLVFPVEPVSDAPIYHLPFAWQWWRSGRLLLVPTPFGEEAAPYFPANGDLWLTWLLATGGGPLVKVGQWPFLALAAAALYAVARRIDHQSLAPVVAPLLWVGLPIVLAQSNIANIDLIWSTFLFVAVYFLLLWIESPDRHGRRLLWWFALSCGIVIGTKLVGALFVLPLLLLAVVVAVRRAAPLRQLGWLSCGVLLPCGFWYARNVWLTGNPLYPMQISAFGHVIAAGWFDRSAMMATAYHLPPAGWRFFANRLVLVSGLTGLALVVVGVTSGLVGALDRTRDRAAREALALCSTLALAQAALYWFVLPYNTQERFLSPALGLALVPLTGLAAGPARDRETAWQRQEQPIVQAVLFALAGWQVLGRLSFSVSLPLVIIAAGVALRWMPRARWFTAGAIIVVGCCFLVWPTLRALNGQPLLRFYPRAGFAARLLPGWEILERSVPATGARVAYAGTNLPYYLAGIGHRNDVEYVNIDHHPDWLPHDYHRERLRRGQSGLAADPWPQWYRSTANYDAWLANLRRRGIDFVFIARENRHGRLEVNAGMLPSFPIERRWADAHPESFVDIGPFEYPADIIPWVRVYRLTAAR